MKQLIEATDNEIELIKNQFRENGIPVSGIFVQSYEGKKYVEPIFSILGDKSAVANEILREIIWPAESKNKCQV